MVDRRWRVRLGAAAELDFANILKWTTENFGARQSRVYRNTLIQAIGELADGPDIVGSRARDEIMPGLRTLHVARHSRRGSHFLMYRVGPGSAIEIVRILHDRMDLQRHIPFVPDKTAELSALQDNRTNRIRKRRRTSGRNLTTSNPPPRRAPKCRFKPLTCLQNQTDNVALPFSWPRELRRILALAAGFVAELNAIYLFREGNGRSQLALMHMPGERSWSAVLQKADRS